MKIKNIIGVDISKEEIGLACHQCKSQIKINNAPLGFKKLIRWMRGQNMKPSETLFVMQHTGLYSYKLEIFLHEHQINFCKIKSGIVNRLAGKIDYDSGDSYAVRLAAYGVFNLDKLVAEVPVNIDVKRSQILLSTKNRLMRQKIMFQGVIKEYQNIGIAEKDIVIQVQRELIETFDLQIKKLMAEIENTNKKHG